MEYIVKNKEHEQDNIHFIDVNPENLMEYFPDWLDFDEIFEYSQKYCGIESTDDIQSLCTGGDHIEPYFSSLSAAEECEMYLDLTWFETQDDEGNWVREQLEFNPDIEVYELY